ncbi:hypothetical protein BVX98_01220, partial [bacterium F11]
MDYPLLILRRFGLLIISFLIIGSSTPSFSEIHGENIFTFRNNKLAGDKTQSFLREGTSIINELGLWGRFKKAPREAVSFNLRGRASNDLGVEPNKWDLKRFDVTYQNPWLEGTLGDIAPEYPEFILSQGLKGGRLLTRAPLLDEFSLEVAGGSTANTWYNAWGPHTTEFRQNAWTVRGQLQFWDRSDIGVSLIRTKDKDDPLAANPTLVSRTNEVFGTDLNLYIARWWQIKGEVARSARNYDTNRARVQEEEKDNAYRAENRFRIRGWSLRGRYYRVNPKFESLVGFATVDSEQWRYTLKGPLSEYLRLGLGYNIRSNNLKKQLSSTTRVRVPSVNLEYRFHEKNTISTDYRFEIRKKDDKTLSEKNESVT